MGSYIIYRCRSANERLACITTKTKSQCRGNGLNTNHSQRNAGLSYKRVISVTLTLDKTEDKVTLVPLTRWQDPVALKHTLVPEHIIIRQISATHTK